jgi:hypothetical protein
VETRSREGLRHSRVTELMAVSPSPHQHPARGERAGVRGDFRLHSPVLPAAEREGVELVVAHVPEFGVAGTPVDNPVDNNRASVDRPARREVLAVAAPREGAYTTPLRPSSDQCRSHR